MEGVRRATSFKVGGSRAADAVSTRGRPRYYIVVAPLILLTVLAGADARGTIARAASLRGPRVVVSGFSEAGDAIDRGVSSVFSSRWTTVSATTSGVYLVTSTAPGPNTYRFVPVAGQPLRVGTYDDLQAALTRSAGFAGISVTGPGRPAGCRYLSGSFHVWDIASDAGGSLTRLDLTYVEHCDAGRAANYGEVLLNDAPHLGALVASATRLTFPDQTPTLPYVLMNPTSRVQPVSLRQSTTTVSHFRVTPVVASCALAVPANSACTYLIRLVPPTPGTYTSTVLAASTNAVLALPLTGHAGGA